VTRYPISFENCDGSGDTCKWLRNPPIRMAELDQLNRLPSVLTVGGRIDWSAPARYHDKTLSGVPIEAYTGNWPIISAPDVQPGGRAFTEMENRSAARVVLLNTVMAFRLFGDSDPLDKIVEFKGVPFLVIGVFKDNASFLSGADRPKAVMPLYSLARHLNARMQDMGLAIKPREGLSRDEVVDDVVASMRGMRGLRPGADQNFNILTPDKLFETYNKIFGMFFLVMIALSAVGLLVGGVGVVAIMMISVTERTREIGVRKALGATRATILWQFLIEAVSLTGTGAMLGLFFGWLVALAIRSATPIPASVPPEAILAAFAASAVTGVLFGMLPAARASRLDPVTALRYE
jgi:putative ABC transport system permease protein